MADVLTKARRSWNMSRIRGRDTKPERVVRELLRRSGFPVRVCCKDLPGTPDIVLPAMRTVIFVHGCFWHRHLGCRYTYEPKSNKEFWAAKFKNNVKRDEKVRRSLRSSGWRVITIWACETRDVETLQKALSRRRLLIARAKEADGDLEHRRSRAEGLAVRENRRKPPG